MQRTGNNGFRMQLGVETGPTFPKLQEVLSGLPLQALQERPWLQATGGWAAEREGALLGSTRKPRRSQRFACTSRRAAPPAACLSGTGRGRGHGGWAVGTLVAHAALSACGCLPHHLTLLTAPACGAALLG